MLYRYRLGNYGLDIKQVEILKILSFQPQTLDEITNKLLILFPKNDRTMLKSEIESYLVELETDNLIISGMTEEQLKEKELRKFDL